ncbi:MAG: nucleotidyltransferase domain-containing protein [Deferrisomatales bacterium]|nr:nucleotidyltransferase domain-containing protein [Deferrisomatales bacterium]
MSSRERALADTLRPHRVAALYAFGSRAGEIFDWLGGRIDKLAAGPADVDLGARPARGTRWGVDEKVRLAQSLEDLLGVGRVDLVVLSEADPFVAAEVVRGERLFALDNHDADEHELYVLRRAGDLVPLERERMALLLVSRR